MWLLAFHLAVVIHHLYCAFFFNAIDFSPHKNNVIVWDMYTIRRSYLTGWNFTFQATYFVVCVAEDIVRLRKQPEQLSKLFQHKTTQAVKNCLFTAIVFPVSAFVTCSFWGFFTYNRELVYPAAIDVVLPLWFNHSLHTTILVAAILEMWLVFHPYRTRKWPMIYIFTFNFCYLNCICLTRYWTGVWAYPMFGLVNWPQKIALFLLAHLAIHVTYEMGRGLNNIMWGDVARKKVDGRTSKKLT